MIKFGDGYLTTDKNTALFVILNGVQTVVDKIQAHISYIKPLSNSTLCLKTLFQRFGFLKPTCIQWVQQQEKWTAPQLATKKSYHSRQRAAFNLFFLQKVLIWNPPAYSQIWHSLMVYLKVDFLLLDGVNWIAMLVAYSATSCLHSPWRGATCNEVTISLH